MDIFSTRKVKGRSASLQLSINAIVVLVMAMLVLGLGLGFIRNLFNGGFSKLGSAIDAVDLANPPTADTPLTINPTIEIKSGKKEQIEIGFYNKGVSGDFTFGDFYSGSMAKRKLACVGSDGYETFANGELTIISPVLDVTSSEAQGFLAFIEAADTVTCTTGNCFQKQTYVCTIEAYACSTGGNCPSGNMDKLAESKQFFIKVI